MFNTHKMVVRAAKAAFNEVAPFLENWDLSQVNWHTSDHFADGTINDEVDALINCLDHFYREDAKIDRRWF